MENDLQERKAKGVRLERRLVAVCKEKRVTVATAESCTGGMVAVRITSVPGSSAVFLGGVVSYADAVKQDVLGVPQTVLEQKGAVSEECACAMAKGARALLKTNIVVSVTGIAGPGGGTPEKPVGLVWFGVADGQEGTRAERRVFAGGRAAVRRQAAEHALELLLEAAARQ